MSSHHSDQMSQRSQVSRLDHSVVVFLKRCLTQWVSDKVTYWAVGWTAKNWFHFFSFSATLFISILHPTLWIHLQLLTILDLVPVPEEEMDCWSPSQINCSPRSISMYIYRRLDLSDWVIARESFMATNLVATRFTPKFSSSSFRKLTTWIALIFTSVEPMFVPWNYTVNMLNADYPTICWLTLWRLKDAINGATHIQHCHLFSKSQLLHIHYLWFILKSVHTLTKDTGLWGWQHQTLHSTKTNS